MFLTSSLNSVYDSALALVYPQPCLVCRQSVESRAYGFACRNCWTATHVFSEADAICWKCGNLSKEGTSDRSREDIRCHRCDEDTYALARACGVYETALRVAVLSLKSQPYIPRHLADLMRQTGKLIPFDQCTRIIPVPLHPARERARGFNQAEIIGRELSRSIRLPLDRTTLLRVVHTERHRAGMDSKARREAVDRVFAVRHPRSVVNESVLSVDDVFTSGATASACSRSLLEAGAKEVFVFTLARANHV